jgi:hypothetical protein
MFELFYDTLCVRFAHDDLHNSFRDVGSDIVPDDRVKEFGFVVYQRHSLFTADQDILKKRAREIVGTLVFESYRLSRANVLGLQTLGPLGNVEFHGLAFLQAAEAARLDRREMHENVFAALPADEPIAFSVVKPLHCSLFCHVGTVSFSMIYAGGSRDN